MYCFSSAKQLQNLPVQSGAMDAAWDQQEPADPGPGRPSPHWPGVAPLVQGGGPRGVPRHLCGRCRESGHLPHLPRAANPVPGVVLKSLNIDI